MFLDIQFYLQKLLLFHHVERITPEYGYLLIQMRRRQEEPLRGRNAESGRDFPQHQGRSYQ
jgi:hypothetical protein